MVTRVRMVTHLPHTATTRLIRQGREMCLCVAKSERLCAALHVVTCLMAHCHFLARVPRRTPVGSDSSNFDAARALHVVTSVHTYPVLCGLSFA